VIPSEQDATDAPDMPDMGGDQARRAAVTMRGVSRHYDVGGGRVYALRDVDLDIGEGEFVVVLGPSGSGKTTLLNLIGALDAATEGTVTVAGRPVTGAGRAALARHRRETVAFVFQTFNLFPTLTAVENVQCAVEIAGRRRGARQVAEAALAEVGLAERADHYPAELSGGEQQRVAIARALATGNPIVVADEPTGDLDYRTGAQVLDVLKQRAGGDRTVIVVTHNREISRVADRVVELAGGRIVRDGPPEGGPVAVTELRW